MATRNNDLNAAISAINSGKKMPVVDLVKTNPEIAAVISKLIAPAIRPNYDQEGQRSLNVPLINNFGSTSRQIMGKTEDAKSTMQLFPDMELSAQILISSIISPKDMGGGEITYTVPDGLLFADVTTPLLAEIKEYFSKDYKIQPLLPKILRQVLFESGSYPVAVIPESSLDDFINGTVKIGTESLSEFVSADGKVKNLGLLGNVVKDTKPNISFSFESLDAKLTKSSDYNPNVKLDYKTAIEGLIQVHDNPFILKYPKLADKVRYNKVMSTVMSVSKDPLGIGKPGNSFNLGNESVKKKFNDSQFTSLVYKGRYANSKQFAKLKTMDETQRETVGAPLVMKLPSESVIPVYKPGNEEEHVGYFIIIDGEGNPLNANSSLDHFGDLQSKLSLAGGGADMSSYLNNKATSAFGPNYGTFTEQIASKVFADVVEADLLSRLRNGVYGNNITLGKNENIYRIMLSRTLANQRTNLLYVPGDLITYFAFRFDEQGIGKSLLDDMRILNSLRAMTLFARVMASVKNSIGTTGVNLKLSGDDPNPQKTIETAIHEIGKTRQQYFPLGLNSPSDLVDWMQKAGYQFTFEGHPGIPDTSIEFSEKNMNYVKPDTELDDELRKRSIMSTGLSPEMVDNGFSGEFATTVVANNILLTKRVMQIQEIFIPQLIDHARKVAFNDGGLIKRLRGVIIENKEKVANALKESDIEPTLFDTDEKMIRFVISEFLSNFEITLPQPDSVTLENQTTAFETYEKAIDAALKYYISADIMPGDMAGEAGQKANDIQNILKAHFMRQWMKQNGYLTELENIIAVDGDGKPTMNVLELQSDHINALVKAAVSLLNKTVPVGNAGTTDINKITDGAALDESNSPTATSGGSGSSGESGGMGFNSDDFGGLDGGEDGLGGPGEEPGAPTTETPPDDGLDNLDDIPPA